MLYAILILGSETDYATLPAQEKQPMLERHAQLRAELNAGGKMGAAFRLAPRDTRTVRRYRGDKLLIDGPFTESKEQLMGLYVIDCADEAEAAGYAERLAFEGVGFEIKPLAAFYQGTIPDTRPG